MRLGPGLANRPDKPGKGPSRAGNRGVFCRPGGPCAPRQPPKGGPLAIGPLPRYPRGYRKRTRRKLSDKPRRSYARRGGGVRHGDPSRSAFRRTPLVSDGAALVGRRSVFVGRPCVGRLEQSEVPSAPPIEGQPTDARALSRVVGQLGRVTPTDDPDHEEGGRPDGHERARSTNEQIGEPLGRIGRIGSDGQQGPPVTRASERASREGATTHRPCQPDGRSGAIDGP